MAGKGENSMGYNHKLGDRSRVVVADAANIETLEGVHEWFDRFYQEEERDALTLFRRLREDGPVARGVGMDFGEFVVPDLWNIHDQPTAMTLTYAGAMRVLNNANLFNHSLYAPELGEQNPLFQDGPRHLEFRRMVMEAFDPRAVKRWEDSALALAGRLIDVFIARDRAELVTEFSRRLPGQVFTTFMGIPLEDSERVASWATRQMKAHDVQTQAAIAGLGAYFSGLIADRRSLSPEELTTRDDLVSLMARVNLNGRVFNDVEINTTLHVLLIGGSDTVYKGLTVALYHLLTVPGILEAVRADRSKIPKLTEESIRLASPNVFGAARRAVQDTDIEGVPIAKGTPVIINITMANRDPARWDKPDQFDLDRPDRPHAGWGLGAHMCLGMHLARVVIHAGVNLLLDRCDDLRLDSDRPAPALVGVGSRWPKALHVRFNPGAAVGDTGDARR